MRLAYINNEELLNKYNDEWDRRYKEYNDYFESGKERFSKSFLKAYYSHSAFHDFFIENINFDKSKETLTFLLCESNTKYSLIYKGVSDFKLLLSSAYNLSKQRFDIQYMEFEFMENGYMKNNILVNIYSEMEIVFKKVVFKKQQ